MLEVRGDFYFPLEARGADAGQELGREHLDDHTPPERPLDRHEHARHAAAGELTLDRVDVANRFLELVLEVGNHRGNRGRGALATIGARTASRQSTVLGLRTLPAHHAHDVQQHDTAEADPRRQPHEVVRLLIVLAEHITHIA